LASIAQSARAQSGALFCVGFAAESENIEAYGQEKRVKKNIPMLIANHGPSTFGQNSNQVSIIDEQGVFPVAATDKLAIARVIVAELAKRLTF
jgi:phosphopantothenoylcysteine decarboxylase/phosphopantothenate--cysteine ligase